MGGRRVPPRGVLLALALLAGALQARGSAGPGERTFIAVKPDGVQRRLVGEIIRRFEQKGFQLVAMKLLQVAPVSGLETTALEKCGSGQVIEWNTFMCTSQASEDLLKDHYISLREQPFYNHLVKYMSSGPIVAMVWQGLDVVKMARGIIGETNPADSMPGTIRGDFCVEMGKNVIHGSDSLTSAQREILLWFHKDELICWEDGTQHWIYN